MQYRFACCASMDKYTIRILSFYNWCFACVAFKMMLLFRTETQQNRASSLARLAVKWPKIGGRVNVQSLLPSNLCPLRVYASKSVSGISATSGRMTPFHTYSEVFFYKNTYEQFEENSYITSLWICLRLLLVQKIYFEWKLYDFRK